MKFDENLATKANKTEIISMKRIIETLTKMSFSMEMEERLRDEIHDVLSDV